MAKFDLTDAEWAVIELLLPTDLRGKEPVDDQRVLNGIFWQLRTGAPWADIPTRYGPYTICGNRFRRWCKRGIWDRLLDAVSMGDDLAIVVRAPVGLGGPQSSSQAVQVAA